jgi:DnaK suppressor protein
MKGRGLKSSDIGKLKTALLRKRKEIVQTVRDMESGSIRAERANVPRMPTHPADIGTDSFELENAVRLVATEGQLLEDIDRALDLIEKGAYGRCENCDKVIGLARLKAIPWARLCLACTDALETTESRTAWLPQRRAS